MSRPRKNKPATLTAVQELDPRSNEAAALKAWREDLLRDLGGEDGLSLMAKELVEQACRTKLILDRMDKPYLPKNSDQIAPHRDRRHLYRKTLIDVMSRLGLDPAKKGDEKKKSNVPSIDDLRKRYDKKAARSA